MRTLFSLPNLLTWLRIVLTPIVVTSILAGDCTRALWISWVAGLTDAADGYLARRMRQTTRLGEYLDPVADKILLTALYLSFGLGGLVPAWLVWLVVGRDVMILSLAGCGWAWKGIRDFPPSLWGKLSTLLQIVTSLAVLSECAYGISTQYVRVCLYMTAAATIWSGIHYFAQAVLRMKAVTR